MHYLKINDTNLLFYDQNDWISNNGIQFYFILGDAWMITPCLKFDQSEDMHNNEKIWIRLILQIQILLVLIRL